MSKILFQNLIKVLDEEIQAYTELRDLFVEKKESLKQTKPEVLGILDNKIIACRNKILKLNEKRKNVGIEITQDENANMSQFIEKAHLLAPDLVEYLEARKTDINKLISELMLLNQQNVELLKHGITISNKMLDSIVNALAPQGSIYNGAGKTDTHDVNMWTINEEI